MSGASLDRIAATLHVSPYHLARLFREQTGYTVHGFRNQVRLRSALDRVRDPGTDLSSLAADLGFSSHSHFTKAFRAAFGVTPSALRGEREPSNEVTAATAS